MIVIFFLIPLSIIIAACFLAAFIWAVRSGQYEDTHTPAMRMLWDDRGANGQRKPAKAPPPPENPTPTKEDEQ